MVDVTLSLIIGSVPAVLVGSTLSSTVPDRYVRPAIAFVIFASGLKYVGVPTTALGWTLCAVLLLTAGLWLVMARPWPPIAAVNGRASSPSSPDPEDLLQDPGHVQDRVSSSAEAEGAPQRS